MLWLIWSMSLLLSAVSLAVMLFLILRRVLRQRRSRVDTEARRSVLKALIAFSQHRNREDLRPILLSVPVHVALEASFEFLSLLRGEEFKEVVATLLECGLHNHAGAQLERGNEAERIHAAEMLAAFGSAMVSMTMESGPRIFA
ncbi:hypothetical protein EET67_21300 [Pseudaminobacter arsenicus]|uniref:HEAT repeat domain-containing protein n=1 Tax=Borborobacter arsenicus TaxID=1851146 RepID=A0A432V161_9HYPH|nr:hypothetical protein [Pseudaminobacter arsenicus]RUM95828.1 hypothetical protein EET67_21300 [Pseudaminobacter arsenicus]